MPNRLTGQIGEQRAQDYLISEGFEIIDTNVFTRWGELDIVASKNNKIHFVEVKSRISTKQGMPYEAVRYMKVSHLVRAIQFYIQRKKLHKYKFQLDVISIQMDTDCNVLELKYYENLELNTVF